MTNAGRFEAFCGRFLTREDGEPLVIEAFQRAILRDFFDGCRETLCIIGKKNGKSSLLAAVALFHLLTEREAEVIIVAASRDQASIMLKQVSGYVRRSEALGNRLRVVQREVRDARTGGRIRVLASDSDTLDGQLPSLALVDELARTKTEEAYGLLRDGLGPRNGRMIAISTAGSDEESPLGRLRKAAHAIPGAVVEGAYRYARRPEFSWHEWSLPAGADLQDLAVLKQANPASWVDEDELRARRDSPSMLPWQLARFTAGQWVQGEQSAIDPESWASCAEPGAEIPAGTSGVLIGLDFATKHDCTALVPIYRRGELAVVGTPTILTPSPGHPLDVEQIYGEIEAMTERWPRPSIVLDPLAGGELLSQRIERELDAVCITHSQKATPMCLASQRLAEAINAGTIRHPDDRELNAHVLAAAAQQVGPSWRFTKPRTGQKIDAVIALAMAHSVLFAENLTPKREPLIAMVSRRK